MTDAPIEGSCHCGAVRIVVPALPANLNDCQCEHCQKRGTLWAYYPKDEVTVTGPTRTYRWGDKTIDFHFCDSCGITTHWTPVDPTRNRTGINFRLFGRDVFQAIPLRQGHPGRR